MLWMGGKTADKSSGAPKAQRFIRTFQREPMKEKTSIAFATEKFFHIIFSCIETGNSSVILNLGPKEEEPIFC
jgi:hypothetical protein